MTESIRLPAAQLKPSTVALPGSKSISNRTLLLAALSDNICEIRSLLKSDDTDRMLEALEKLGVRIEFLEEGRLQIQGTGGRFPNRSADLFLGNAGTAFRPLTAVLAVLGGDYHLHGVPRMHERPIGDLVDALRTAGADVRYLGNENYPPLQINERSDNGVHEIPIKGNVSSQFLTALLMALPLTGEAFDIRMVGELISKPYIDITLKLMAQFGVHVVNEDYRVFKIPAGARYHAPEVLHVEGDASSASYFLGAGLISGAPIRVTGIGLNSIQGDVAFARELEKIGAHVVWGDNFIEISRPAHQSVLPFDLDANHIPDAAMTLAVIALASGKPCTLRNIGSWRVKETDRIAAMATELRKLGAEVVEEPEAIYITPPAALKADVAIDTYDDHRVAMCFSLVSLLGTPVIINDPKCTHKTFPTYFEVFASITE
ncbi:3-phosphoshikimate 1-carboxyvinyltransferase [Neisseria animalis]|uniref:3-phosphoshikimate 1-carboxyvinyltransferase n=1 Tax=Neisseria animalis TaxID=492 RepID=A0A5P3MNV9_NEIAN|nr:3-phosphoshikimate 1-carboxyvinyltransferase [Neisseria animalis]QEY23244.1 3-phosphoshikimate 1-carboxyvinyltransferase [Neisseria animalis]ROW32001.1 3-phosphoshikimate 1-carboxyvinyltransferase [Neisseria animalis]VEE08478.1 3-phosphoshikimate 1-carboxyvinyltransferase [Neisseria animalis]